MQRDYPLTFQRFRFMRRLMVLQTTRKLDKRMELVRWTPATL